MTLIYLIPQFQRLLKKDKDFQMKVGQIVIVMESYSGQAVYIK